MSVAKDKSTRFSDSDFSFHKPTDPSDPGFILKGHKLRWLAPGVQVRRGGRVWTTMKLSYLPPKVVETLNESMEWLVSGGDVVRRREMVLAYATLESIDKRDREKKELQMLNEGVLRGATGLSHGIQSKGEVSGARSRQSDKYS